MITNKIIESILSELDNVPELDEQFSIFMNSAMNSLMRLEQKARIRKIKDFPLIFNGKTDILKTKNEIRDYVLINLEEYVAIHGLGIIFFDNVKINYWLGMFIYEKLDSFYGIKLLQETIIKDIQLQTNLTMDKMMIKKINDIAKKEKEVFFKYYGRFGLYHSLKHHQRTLQIISKKSPLPL